MSPYEGVGINREWMEVVGALSLGVDSRGTGGGAASGLTRKGAKYIWPLGFLANNTQLATRNPKFRTEIEPECSENLFFLVFT